MSAACRLVRGTLARARSDYGFDPLKLGETNLDRLVECELLHARWCMLATAGCLAVELGGYGTWIEAAQWPVSGAPLTYFGNEVPINLGAVVAIEVLSMAYLEVARNGETDPVKRCYPGGPFDPLGLSKDADYFMTMKKKEIANGRLAMFSMLGYYGQAAATGAGPIDNWLTHISDPFHTTVASNKIAVPFL